MPESPTGHFMWVSIGISLKGYRKVIVGFRSPLILFLVGVKFKEAYLHDAGAVFDAVKRVFPIKKSLFVPFKIKLNFESEST